MNPGDSLAPFATRAFEESGLLRAVIDAVPDPIFCKDRVGRYLMTNRANCELFGLEAQAVLGQTVFDLPGLREFAPLYHADDMAVMATGHPIVNREEPFARPDGRHGWFLTSKYPLRNADGEVIGLVGIARDVSDLKRATDELTQARQRLTDHIENSPLAIIEWQPDFSVQRWAGQAEAIFGWTSDEVVGRHLTDWKFTYPDDAAAVDASCAQLLDGRALRNVTTQRNFAKDGRVLHCVWHNSVLRDKHGRIVSLLSLIEDVTERVKAEDAARDNQRLYRSLIEATGTGYVVMDPDTYVIEANAEYLRLTGRPDIASIRGHRCYEWTAAHDLERHVRAVAACTQSGYIRGLEVDYVWPDGRTLPVEINARLIEPGGGRQMIALVRDITSRRVVEAERQLLERKLQETQRLESLAALAGGIGHDFNNLLTGVLGNASVAAAELPQESPVVEYLEQIEVAGARAAELCKQMLAYAGKSRFVIRQLQINQLVADMSDLLKLSVGRDADLEIVLSDTVPPVLADAAQIRQAILNLVTNAGEAVGNRQEGSIRVITGVKKISRGQPLKSHVALDLQEGDYASIEVRDNGCGVPAEVRSRIFDPFFTTKFDGRGLGLAAALGIVRGHRGGIEMESEPGRGTTFRILLPVDTTPPETEFNIPSAPSTWRGHGSMLVIDDEVTIRRTATQMLRALGFEVQVASDGMEGIDLFLTNPDLYSAVLLDLTMPRLDGLAVYRSLRDLRPNVRVIVMSGYDEAEVIGRFGPDRPSAFLQKPFRLPELRDKLRSVLVDRA